MGAQRREELWYNKTVSREMGWEGRKRQAAHGQSENLITPEGALVGEAIWTLWQLCPVEGREVGCWVFALVDCILCLCHAFQS